MAEVAVIMAAYNGEKFIAEQIDSILDSIRIKFIIIRMKKIWELSVISYMD